MVKLGLTNRVSDHTGLRFSRAMGPDNPNPPPTRPARHALLALTALGVVAAWLLTTGDPASAGPVVASPAPIQPVSDSDLQSIALGVGGMCATVGSIVVVFIQFTFQRLSKLESRGRARPELDFAVIRERTRLKLLLVVGTVSMTTLLAMPIILMFGLTAGWQEPITLHLTLISIGIFTYGVLSMLTAIMSYMYLERPFMTTS